MTKIHQAVRSRRRKATPTEISSAAYTRFGTIGIVSIETMSCHCKKYRLSGGMNVATTTSAANANIAVASRSGQRSSRSSTWARANFCEVGSASAGVRSAEVLRSTAICARSPVIPELRDKGDVVRDARYLANSLTVVQ